MKRNLCFVTLVASLVAFAACQREITREDSKAQEAPMAATEAPDPQHAPAVVRPGSHEDWCGEHQVPESLCTRCNSSLVAAFKATGDWCAEHGLPESQCTLCNPNLRIERPPKQEGVR